MPEKSILHDHSVLQNAGNYQPVWHGCLLENKCTCPFYVGKISRTTDEKQGVGSIVVTASNAGVQFDREMIAYATSKHAAVAMTKQMAIDYARFNIRVNALCPGWVDTAFNNPFMKQMGGRDALEKYVREQMPKGRLASVDEISEIVLFLASDRSSFMTGQALVIDGGECLQ